MFIPARLKLNYQKSYIPKQCNFFMKKSRLGIAGLAGLLSIAGCRDDAPQPTHMENVNSYAESQRDAQPISSIDAPIGPYVGELTSNSSSSQPNEEALSSKVYYPNICERCSWLYIPDTEEATMSCTSIIREDVLPYKDKELLAVQFMHVSRDSREYQYSVVPGYPNSQGTTEWGTEFVNVSLVPPEEQWGIETFLREKVFRGDINFWDSK